MATEVVVAAAILLTLLAAFALGMASRQRIVKSSRSYRMAINELANQLETLAILPSDKIDEAVKHVQVSSATSGVLSKAQLSGEVLRDENGVRIRLSIQWERGGEALPVEMTAWCSNAFAQTHSGSEVSQ